MPLRSGLEEGKGGKKANEKSRLTREIAHANFCPKPGFPMAEAQAHWQVERIAE
jgi:hypothetical protein